jgi:ferredoxin
VKVLLDADACVGHGRCYAVAPRVFGADDLGRCVVLEADPNGELLEQARVGVRACPEQALSLDEPSS